MFGLFTKIKDPVCGMKIDKNKTEFSFEYQGKLYYFCSQNCKEKFETDSKNDVSKEKEKGCCHP